MKRYILITFFAIACLLGYAQATVTVTGTVIGASDNEPLIGASVKVIDGPQAVNTDIDGNYRLANVPVDAKLEVQYIGYESQIVPVNGRTEIDIVLRETSAQLEEVVVIGYGVVKKSDLTSSISTVKSKQIAEVTAGNAMDALQGKVNGVQISSGGGPGASPKVIIRGVTTVNGSNPLYVVDGMPVGDNINFLNTSDIGSMKATGWELSANWRDNAGDFRYDLGLQLSGVRNKAIKFTGDGPILDGEGMPESITKSEDGELIGRFYGYKCLGIFQSWSQINAHSQRLGV